MALAIYKSGQGYWTRMLTAIGAGVLTVAGTAWLWNEMSTIRDAQTQAIAQMVMAIVVIIGGGGVIYWLLNKPRIADFMIQTESEMKKVNWPSRRELIGSTWIVICGTLFMALLLFVIDLVFYDLAKLIRILEGRSVLEPLLQQITGS